MTAARLKIMLFSHICSKTHITGAEKLLLFFAHELKASHDCLLVVPNEGLLSQEARAKGIATFVVSYPNFYEMYSPGPYFHAAFHSFVRESKEDLGALMGLLLEVRPDLVINNTCVNMLPPVAAQALGIPVAWIITEQIQSTPFTSLSVDAIARYSKWIIGISNAALRPFRGGLAESRTRILYPSWNEHELERERWTSYREIKRAEIGWDESVRVIGYVSSDIYPNKGLEHFVHMAIELAQRHSDIRFIIVGKVTDEGYYNRCTQLVKTAGLTSRFYVNSFEVQIQKIYPAIDLLVIPSLVDEGFGMTALEGLLFGKPVIAYSSGGLEEILLLTGNGSFVIEKGSIKGLVHAVETLLAHGESIKHVGSRNSQAAWNAFGIGSYRMRLAEFTRQAADELPRHGPLLQPREVLEQKPVVLVKGSGPAVYLLHRGFRYLFPNEGTMRGWNCSFAEVSGMQDEHLLHLPKGGVLQSAVNKRRRKEAKRSVALKARRNRPKARRKTTKKRVKR